MFLSAPCVLLHNRRPFGWPPVQSSFLSLSRPLLANFLSLFSDWSEARTALCRLLLFLCATVKTVRSDWERLLEIAYVVYFKHVRSRVLLRVEYCCSQIHIKVWQEVGEFTCSLIRHSLCYQDHPDFWQLRLREKAYRWIVDYLKAAFYPLVHSFLQKNHLVWASCWNWLFCGKEAKQVRVSVKDKCSRACCQFGKVFRFLSVAQQLTNS